uniref:Uncharacterized protein n=1 Tax=Zeugodacus cucurbitae TaxID=28588 RepID=A0A0A1X738_ZEUCU
MRYQPWKKPFHLRAQRTPMKFCKSLGFNSIYSRFYNAAKQKSLEARKQKLEKRKTYASENRIIKRSKEERDKKEKIHTFVELSRKYDMLRAEQMNLERQIKRRTSVLLKAVYRHRKSTQILGELERTLATYSEQLKQTLSNNILSAAIEHGLNGGTMEANHNKLNITRTMGGSDLPTQYNTDLMHTFVKKFTIMRNYARRWMQKAHIKRRRSSVDLATLIKKQQRLSWEPFREAFALHIKEPIKPAITNEQYERGKSLKSHSLTSFRNTISLRNKQKREESLRSLLAPSEIVVASEESSKLPKRTKKLKIKQSATSDIDENARRQRTGKRRGRGRRRSSRKSQQSTTIDGLKKRQKKRKARRKSIKSLDNTGQDMKERGKSARKGRKRRSKDNQRLSKISRESGSHARTLQTVSDANTDKEALMFEAVKNMVAVQTAADKFKGKMIEAQSETQQLFRVLEEYWGVSLREDYTLKKLERLNSILDELIVEEEKKPQPPQPLPPPSAPSPHASKHALTSRKVMPKRRKHEIRDLEKLLILLKECKKCQKKQDKLKTSRSDCTVLCQKEYYDAIRNAAGLPDYFPDDSDFSLICSCNSVI